MNQGTEWGLLMKNRSKKSRVSVPLSKINFLNLCMSHKTSYKRFQQESEASAMADAPSFVRLIAGGVKYDSSRTSQSFFYSRQSRVNDFDNDRFAVQGCPILQILIPFGAINWYKGIATPVDYNVYLCHSGFHYLPWVLQKIEKV
jgi:hypothetical protein